MGPGALAPCYMKCLFGGFSTGGQEANNLTFYIGLINNPRINV